MVTAKKVSTPKSVEAAVVAPVKTVAAKKTAAKKTVAPVAAAPVAAAPVAAAPVAAAPVAAPPVPAVTPEPAAAIAKTSVAPSNEPTTAPIPEKATLSSEQRNHYVEVAAFYIAERRCFAPGNPADDWAAAEAEVDRLIASGQFGS